MNNSIITFVEAFGITLGSFLANVLVAYGRRKTIIVSNIVIIMATGMTLVQNLWMIVIGKLIFSIAAGCILIASNVYLNESIPRHLSSLFGNLINFGIITAIFIELTFGLAFPDIDDEPEKAMNTQLWRVAYGFQVIPAFLSLLAWLFIHKYETPQFIVDKGKNEEAMRYLK